MVQLQALVVRLATENRTWGYTRLQGALANLNLRVACGTIANILRQHGLEPAPERAKRTTWQEFLRTHWDVLAGADFFTVEVWTATGLTRFAVFFVMHVATRRVEIAGLVADPDSAWVTQCSRQLAEAGGFLWGTHFLLHDRDPLFSEAFREIVATAGVQTVHLPPRSPHLNACAERFVRTIKESCLSRLILAANTRYGARSASSSRTIITSEITRDDTMRSCVLRRRSTDATGRSCRSRLGGLLKYDHRPAA